MSAYRFCTQSYFTWQLDVEGYTKYNCKILN